MVEEIKKYALFKSVPTETLEQLIASGEISKLSYPKSSTMHKKGMVCEGIQLICSGKLVAYSLAANGSETIVFEFGQGDLIGANFLFSEVDKFPLNVFCKSDSTAFFISKEAVRHLLLNYDFTMVFIRKLSVNAQRMNRKIAIFTRGSLRKNLLDYFTALSADQASSTVYLPTTKKQLADHFGVQRPSLFRELKRMKDEGLIAIHNRKITLLKIN